MKTLKAQTKATEALHFKLCGQSASLGLSTHRSNLEHRLEKER